ncbi:MAG: class I tRNA ligase family protein [Deltaproteobacteria bacterium]|nr:class I tRNA ligase family protein [Deltaproteobacteria bacterium]
MAQAGLPKDIPSILARVRRPRRAVVTAGMPYANGPLHLGHLAGAHVPADIHARYLRMLIGPEHVLFVCGTDEHGSTSELSALAAGVPIRDYVGRIHDAQDATLRSYSISLDVYAGTSRPDCFPTHAEISRGFLGKLAENGLLAKRRSRQWFDPKVGRFLPDRFVRGRCPNPRCENDAAYGDECDRCGTQYEPSDLREPRSAVSDATPELRETVHWWLDMWAVSETLRAWLETKKKAWRPAILADVLDRVQPALRFPNSSEAAYKALKAELPAHKSKYTPGKLVLLQFASKADLATASAQLAAAGIAAEPANDWGQRPITRDIAWGIPVTGEPELEGKTLYVWPDSLIAPLAFTRLALAARGEDPARADDYWRDPEAQVVQFIGQDNVFFYVLMQGALWLGTQADPHRLPVAGELQLTDVVSACHLLVGGEKMSKSRGNFHTGDELLGARGYDVDQVRYYLALLGLADKPSDFDFARLDERNRFLAGPLNAAFERPLSAAHSKFGGRVPEGRVLDKVVADTTRIVERYVRAMERSDYPSLLFDIENYARTINSLFTQWKPHDDRHPEEGRRDALYSSFYVLKTLMILLHPFVPGTMDRLRESLRLPPDVFRVDQLGTPIPAGHELGPKGSYFPTVADAAPPA